MGYQWISRFLANDLVCCDAVVEPFAREILARLAETGPSTSAQEPIPLILDQTKVSDRHQILMLSVRWGERALPLAPACAGAGSGGSRKPRAPSASLRKKSCSRSLPAGCLPIWEWFCSPTASTQPPR